MRDNQLTITKQKKKQKGISLNKGCGLYTFEI